MLVFVSRCELHSDQINEKTGSSLLVWMIHPGMGFWRWGPVGGGLGCGARERINPQLQVAELENRHRALRNLS
ncbi:hypothetical protein CesoFtcFv8_009993 [Champsocephalus esox]|uniref:Uncharacterized protein n=1 Tax=Champsocephalus esox TaxID=159716 RepID=A0AAN8C4W7_9TELE|nr:hypothetical protein CesoFtcFv8_009993 [Champsocephalus esox]